MGTKLNVALVGTLLFTAYAVAGDAQMVVVPGKDVSGTILKRLGLPDQTYCWKACMEEASCTGTRWGTIAGSNAGQCQLMSGALTLIEPHEVKTEDGQQIRVVASRKETDGAKK
jgi:hypothetical protein